jgi:hypothetical protein
MVKDEGEGQGQTPLEIIKALSAAKARDDQFNPVVYLATKGVDLGYLNKQAKALLTSEMELTKAANEIFYLFWRGFFCSPNIFVFDMELV